MSFQTIPTNAQGQVILRDMIFENKFAKSPLFSKILANVKKSVLNGDDMRSRVITANSLYAENAQYSGNAVGYAGGLAVAEYAYKKKTQAIPIDLDLVSQLRLDPANNPKDALTLDNWFSSVLNKAYTLLEWQWLGDGSGAVAHMSSTAAYAVNGLITLDSKTPRIVFDKLLTTGTYVVCGTISSGVVTPFTGDTSNIIQGYVTLPDPVAKTFYLAESYAAAIAGTASADYDDSTTGASAYVWLATPSTTASQHTAAVNILSGLGLNNAYATTDSETTMGCMDGILKLNEYHSASTYGMYGVSGATHESFNPIRLAGSSTTGLTPAILQAVINDMNVDGFTQPLIATSNIIWSDWCDDYRESSYVQASEGGARNFEPGFRVNGTIVPVHHTGYWDDKGVAHGLDLSTFDVIYTPSKYLKAVGEPNVPGYGFRHFDVLHPQSAYYAAGNQLIFDGNLVTNGLRNRNFVIDSLQTTLLSTAS